MISLPLLIIINTLYEMSVLASNSLEKFSTQKGRVKVLTNQEKAETKLQYQNSMMYNIITDYFHL